MNMAQSEKRHLVAHRLRGNFEITQKIKIKLLLYDHSNAYILITYFLDVVGLLELVVLVLADVVDGLMILL